MLTILGSLCWDEMEPVTAALGIASSTVTLAGLALSVGKTLTTVVNTHRQYAALLYSLIGACKAIEVAWNRIHAWVEARRFVESESDASFYEQLMGSIDAGEVILGALQDDLEPFIHVKPGERSATGTWRALLNETTLRDHWVRLNLQVSSVHLLFATANLLAVPTIVLYVDALIRIRPEPRARKLICDCLRPVFRKDEESAWTIVATRAPSSLYSFSGISRIEGGPRNSIYSERSFAFTNDLLTAPVYKRLALSTLRRPRLSRKISGFPPSSSIKLVAENRTLTDKSLAGSVHQSCVTVTDKRSAAAATTNHVDAFDTHLVQAINAAGEGFTSSVVADYVRSPIDERPTSSTSYTPELGTNNADGWILSPPSQWLPLRASVERAYFTADVQIKIDEELLDAVESGTLWDIAKALDAGADINAVKLPEPCETPLQLTKTRFVCCSALKLLLKYKNANLYVRDRKGRNLLHRAVLMECEKCIQSLLDIGVSMNDEDLWGYSAFDDATTRCVTSQPLLTLLKHAVDHGVMNNGVSAYPLTDLNPHALFNACHSSSIRKEHARLLLHFGWSLIPDSNPFLLLSLILSLILKEEQWLLTEMVKHPKTIAQICEQDSLWEVILLELTSRPRPNTAVILRYLCDGIEYGHPKTEIRHLAIKEQCYSLLEIITRDADQIVWHESAITWHNKKDLDDARTTGEQPNPQKFHDLDAVETQIHYNRRSAGASGSDLSAAAAAKEEEKAKCLARWALADFRNRSACEIPRCHAECYVVHVEWPQFAATQTDTGCFYVSPHRKNRWSPTIPSSLRARLQVVSGELERGQSQNLKSKK